MFGFSANSDSWERYTAGSSLPKFCSIGCSQTHLRFTEAESRCSCSVLCIQNASSIHTLVCPPLDCESNQSCSKPTQHTHSPSHVGLCSLSTSTTWQPRQGKVVQFEVGTATPDVEIHGYVKVILLVGITFTRDDLFLPADQLYPGKPHQGFRTPVQGQLVSSPLSALIITSLVQHCTYNKRCTVRRDG